MNHTKSWLAGGAVCFLLLASGCATRLKDTARTPHQDGKGAEVSGHLSSISFEDRVEANARFATAVAYELREERDRALLEFYKAALADWENEELVSDVARRLLAAKESTKAVEILSKCARRPDASAPLLTLLAFAHREAGDKTKAIAADRRALQAQPDYLPAYQSLVQIHLGSGMPEEARSVLDEASKAVRDEKPETLLGLAETYAFYMRAAPEKAEDIRPRLAELAGRIKPPENATPALLARMAEIHTLTGEHGKAANIYVDLLNRVRGLPGRRERQIHAFMRNKDWGKASEQLESLVRQNPGNARAYLILSGIAYEEKQFDRAADYLEKAILFKPDLEDAYYDLAALKISANKAHEALDLIARARQQFKPSFSMEFYSGLASNQLKDYAAAVKHLLRAEEMAAKDDPKRLNHFFYFQLGATLERNKEHSQSEQAFRKCLSLKPDFVDALNYLGYMWAERGEKLPEARKMIEQAVKAEPENAAFLDSMAWVLHKQNDHKRALEWMLKALKHTEEPDATLYDHLGDIYAALKRAEEARDAWRKSLEIETSDEVRRKLESTAK